MSNTDNVTHLPTAPEGFTEVSTAVEFPPAVEWERTDEVRGTVKSILTAKVQRKEGKVDVRVMILDTADGERALWECAGLRDFFNDARRGLEVLVQQTGTKKLPGKPSPMRTFRAFVRQSGK